MDNICPLCTEEFDLDDINFYPCECLYQICRFCWHRLRTETTEGEVNGGQTAAVRRRDFYGLCPHCRSPYGENPYKFEPPTSGVKSRKQSQTDKAVNNKGGEKVKNLSDLRVVQKNLLFAILNVHGWTSKMSGEEALKKSIHDKLLSLLSRFGKIHKIVISLNTTNNNTGQQPPQQSQTTVASAYVTYESEGAALKCVYDLNYEGKGEGRSTNGIICTLNANIKLNIVKISLGTTKYCAAFVKHYYGNSSNNPQFKCNKQDCMYLHKLGDSKASFTKDEMSKSENDLKKHLEYERRVVLEWASKNKENEVVFAPPVQSNNIPRPLIHPNNQPPPPAQLPHHSQPPPGFERLLQSSHKPPLSSSPATMTSTWQQPHMFHHHNHQQQIVAPPVQQPPPPVQEEEEEDEEEEEEDDWQALDSAIIMSLNFNNNKGTGVNSGGKLGFGGEGSNNSEILSKLFKI